MTDKQQINKLVPQEWPCFLSVDDVGQKPLKLTISPDEAQKKALSKRLGIVSIDALEASVEVTRNRGNMILHVTGRLTANITQKCVVTLQPVQESIDDDFEGWFVDPHQAVSFTKAKRERLSLQEQMEQPILEEHEDPEPVVEGKIDLGEFITQHFSLSINPYPRAEGSDYENILGNSEKEPEGIYDNPFAALKEWKAREQKKDKQ